MTSFQVLRGVPGVPLYGETVEFSASTFDEAQKGWAPLVRVGNTVLMLDMQIKPEYKTKTPDDRMKARTAAWLQAEALSAKQTPPQ